MSCNAIRERGTDKMSGSPKIILLADDNQRFRTIISRMIQKIFPRVTVLKARDGQEAINYLESQSSFDLIITDANMPKKNGRDVLATAKLIFPQAPVILITGGTELSTLGFDMVLIKPFELGLFKKTITKLCT